MLASCLNSLKPPRCLYLSEQKLLIYGIAFRTYQRFKIEITRLYKKICLTSRVNLLNVALRFKFGIWNMGINLKIGLEEVKEVLTLRNLWLFWGWLDIRQRYRRSLLGPLWVTMTMAVSVFATGFVYAFLFKQDISEYLPYVAAGFVIWSLISGFIGEAGSVLILNEGFINQIQLPILIYPTRLLWRYIIMFLHHMVVLATVLYFFSPFTLTTLLAACLGFCLTCLNLYWMGIILSLVSLRLRDLPILVTTIFQVMFLITPVIWPAKALGGKMWVVMWNPFYHLLEGIRMPLINGVTEQWFLHVFVLTIMGTVGSLFAFLLISSWKQRVVYWL